MTTQLEEGLGAVLKHHQLLEHPFYRRWEAGELRRDELTHYAEQYRYFEAMLPVFLETLSTQLPQGPARDSVLDNLSDEVSAPSHLSLFDVFAQSFDAADVAMSPAMSHLVTSYTALLERGPQSALAGLWAYEGQAAEIAESKAEGLVKHYGTTSEAVEFWRVHGAVEVDHATWTLEALAQSAPDTAAVESATRLIGEAWWSFLDERELLAV
jgi:pyrroloquinoline-quinone synthase